MSEIEEKETEPEKILKAVIPLEFVEGMKEGKYKLMEALTEAYFPT